MIQYNCVTNGVYVLVRSTLLSTIYNICNNQPKTQYRNVFVFARINSYKIVLEMSVIYVVYLTIYNKTHRWCATNARFIQPQHVLTGWYRHQHFVPRKPTCLASRRYYHMCFWQWGLHAFGLRGKRFWGLCYWTIFLILRHGYIDIPKFVGCNYLFIRS